MLEGARAALSTLPALCSTAGTGKAALRRAACGPLAAGEHPAEDARRRHGHRALGLRARQALRRGPREGSPGQPPWVWVTVLGVCGACVRRMNNRHVRAFAGWPPQEHARASCNLLPCAANMVHRGVPSCTVLRHASTRCNQRATPHAAPRCCTASRLGGHRVTTASRPRTPPARALRHAPAPFATRPAAPRPRTTRRSAVGRTVGPLRRRTRRRRSRRRSGRSRRRSRRAAGATVSCARPGPNGRRRWALEASVHRRSRSHTPPLARFLCPLGDPFGVDVRVMSRCLFGAAPFQRGAVSARRFAATTDSWPSVRLVPVQGVHGMRVRLLHRTRSTGGAGVLPTCTHPRTRTPTRSHTHAGTTFLSTCGQRV